MQTDLCPQTLHRIVQTVAADRDRDQTQAIEETRETPMPEQMPSVDLYDPKIAEVIVMEDGILAKAQKPQRKPDVKRPTRFIATNLATFQKPDGRFQTVMESLQREGDASFSVADALRAAFVTAWGNTEEKLAIVALSDGATAIRTHLLAVFGATLVVILDWYHLTEKLKVHLSQICHGNVERKAVQKAMEQRLWRGDVGGALEELAKVDPRKPEAATDLLGYLEKHRSEIIDYERRQAAGKPIGSGRIEKSADQAIGHRQKRKGMSWVEKGSRALACLRCIELNGQWEDFWEQRAAA